MTERQLKNILEGALLCAGEALSLDRLMQLFAEDEAPTIKELRAVLDQLTEEYSERGLELCLVASGYRLKVRDELTPYIAKLWQTKTPRYSRALLETLAIIVYRQPATRGQIEEVRGVAVSTSIIKTLLDREWIKVLGHRDVPGRPALYGTSTQFLDDFNLKSLSQLPTLKALGDIEEMENNLQVNLGFKSSQDEIETETEVEVEH